MYEVSITTHFSAAHRLVDHEGACANLHGHNWVVSVYIQGDELNRLGMLVDFHEVKTATAETLAELDHGELNSLPAFAQNNPTSEHIARYVYKELSGRLNGPGYRVHRVTVRETPGSEVAYWE